MNDAIASLLSELRQRGAWAVAESLPPTDLPSEILEAAAEIFSGSDSSEVNQEAIEGFARLVCLGLASVQASRVDAPSDA